MNLIFITPDDTRWYNLENLPNEDWLDINDYTGLYQISNYGRVKSLKNNIIIKPMRSKNTNYRYIVSLSNNGKVKQLKCHRLVAKAFIPNPDNLPEVNHKNPVSESVCDNRASELEWATHSSNMRWRVMCGNQPKNTFIKKGESVNNKRVVQLDENNVYLQTFPSLRTAMRLTGIHETNISKVCHNKVKTAGGYKFVFEEEYKQ